MTWIGEDEEPGAVVRATAAHLEAVFGRRTEVVRIVGRPSGTLDPRRRQHSSTAILHWLQSGVPPGGRLLALTDVDLFIPVLTFVFGEAQLGGRAAVVSLARLADAHAARLTATRLAKEAAHEVGHLFGLVHCANAGCVMRRSGALHDVDDKGSAPCADCLVRLEEACPDEPGMEAT